MTPQLVSRGQWEDELTVTFWGYFLFVTYRDKVPLEENYTVRTFIRRQTIPSKAGVDLGTVAKVTLYSVLVSFLVKWFLS